MKKENGLLLVLLAITAVINVGLARVVRLSCSATTNAYRHFCGEGIVPLCVEWVLNVQWWPWLLFAAACVLATAAVLGVKRRRVLVLAIIILLIDIAGLAFTLFFLTWPFADRPGC